MKLQKLLQATKVIEESRAKVDISVINDPTEFLEQIQAAAAVTKFQVSFSLPNVWDADKDFQQPFQETSREVGAEQAAATFKGEDLQRDSLVKLTRAAAAVLEEYGITGSMSRRGNCWNNACSETLFGSLKVERLYGQRFRTRRHAKDEAIAWLLWYNKTRLHSTLDYISPMQFEENWLSVQSKQTRS